MPHIDDMPRAYSHFVVSAAISRLPSNVVNGSTEIHSLRFGFGTFVVLSISADQLRGRASIYFVKNADRNADVKARLKIVLLLLLHTTDVFSFYLGVASYFVVSRGHRESNYHCGKAAANTDLKDQQQHQRAPNVIKVSLITQAPLHHRVPLIYALRTYRHAYTSQTDPHTNKSGGQTHTAPKTFTHNIARTPSSCPCNLSESH